MFIYGNTAPRRDQLKIRRQNEGEKLVYAQLQNGLEIMAVNAGYCFSFVKPYLKSLRAVKVADSGSQFRSRDFFPQTLADHLRGKNVLSQKIDIHSIPEVPNRKIAWVDGYGNLKTTIRSSSLTLKPGSKIKIKINQVQKTALVSNGIFSIPEGKLAFSPGSSGHTDRFCEIILRGGSAARLFNSPAPGSAVKLG